MEKLPVWRNGRRAGLKIPLLAVFSGCNSSLKIASKPLILLVLISFQPFHANSHYKRPKKMRLQHKNQHTDQNTFSPTDHVVDVQDW
ncbi:MAG: hypothetical protein ABSH15_11720 [Verrucomicrobiota bacterium]